MERSSTGTSLGEQSARCVPRWAANEARLTWVCGAVWALELPAQPTCCHPTTKASQEPKTHPMRWTRGSERRQGLRRKETNSELLNNDCSRTSEMSGSGRTNSTQPTMLQCERWELCPPCALLHSAAPSAAGPGFAAFRTSSHSSTPLRLNS